MKRKALATLALGGLLLAGCEGGWGYEARPMDHDTGSRVPTVQQDQAKQCFVVELHRGEVFSSWNRAVGTFCRVNPVR